MPILTMGPVILSGGRDIRVLRPFPSSHSQKILEHRSAFLRQDTFRMELDTFNHIFFVANAHDNPLSPIRSF